MCGKSNRPFIVSVVKHVGKVPSSSKIAYPKDSGHRPIAAAFQTSPAFARTLLSSSQFQDARRSHIAKRSFRVRLCISNTIRKRPTVTFAEIQELSAPLCAPVGGLASSVLYSLESYFATATGLTASGIPTSLSPDATQATAVSAILALRQKCPVWVVPPTSPTILNVL